MNYSAMITAIQQATDEIVSLYIQKNRLMKLEGNPMMDDIIDAVYLGTFNAFAVNKPTSAVKLSKMLGMNRNTLHKTEKRLNVGRREARFDEVSSLAGLKSLYQDKSY